MSNDSENENCECDLLDEADFCDDFTDSNPITPKRIEALSNEAAALG